MDTANGDEETIPRAIPRGERAQTGYPEGYPVGWDPRYGDIGGADPHPTPQAKALYTRARAREGRDEGMVVSPIPCTLSLSSLGGGMANGMPKRVSGSDGGCDAYLAVSADPEDRIEGWRHGSRGDPDLGQTPGYPHLGPFWAPSWTPSGPDGIS